MPRFLNRDLAAVVAAVLLPLVVAAIIVPFRGALSNTNVALILVVAVVAVATAGNRLAGALAAVSAAVWFDFFFTQPYERFTIVKAADVQTAVLLLVVGLVTSQLAAWARRLKVITVTDADYLARVHEVAALSQSATSAAAVVTAVQEQLTDLLHLRDCRFEYGTLLGHPPRLEQDGTVTVGRRHWDVERKGLPDQEIELRTFANGRFYGRFMLRPAPGSRPSLQARLVAVTLADHAGHALGVTAERGTR
ncbi:DUF4118 domain-containing protein [Microtetraspora malaysiensis]|uniref:DUF4118 domain-containing protein n=1 Tax=Microtetraspora malaysiensis TaxID=161358 RepID=UPI000832FE47|nr:DUF4118 domain-containing protein [Microtetraspora malaysiensis]